MLPTALSPGSDAASFVDDTKLSPSHLYYRQPHSIQIIELVECPAPPPRTIASVLDDVSSSDYTSSVSSDYDNNESDEEVVSSYCSSDLPPSQLDHTIEDDKRVDSDSSVSQHPRSQPHPELASGSTSHRCEFDRILAWRESFSPSSDSCHTASTCSSPHHSASPSLKRKLQDVLEIDGENVTNNLIEAPHVHPAKRLCTHQGQISGSRCTQFLVQGCTFSLDTHPCPACDAAFATRSELRLHGIDEHSSGACRVAVEYAFE